MTGEPAVPDDLPPLAWGPVLAVAAGVTALLLAMAGRYGYHRDELYFLEAGEHLAWGYPDQPPVVPLIARLTSMVAEGSLVALRTPSALAIGGLVLLSALVARELGGRRGAQALTATVMATSSLSLGAGHLLSTTTFSLLAWAAVLFVVLRALRTGADWLWAVAGVIAGVGLLANTVVIFLLAAVLGGLLIGGPRRALTTPWPWVGGLIALVIWSPYLVWQGQHGWPQLEVSASIAAGESGTSEPRELFLPFQIVLLNPFVAPIWIAGLVRLFRDPALSWCRGLAWCYPLLAAVFIASGGKPYYIAGIYPLLVGAGAALTIDWVRQSTARRVALVAALVLFLPAVPVTLPVLPASDVGDTPILDLNYDAGEMIGWPTFVDQVATVVEGADGAVALLTQNYGEAGALDRYGPALGLPRAYSGDMGYWYWGPPPDDAKTVVAVGFAEPDLRRACGDLRLADRLDNGLGVDNDEQGAPIWICRDPVAPWA
ncbi:MAG: glycosyltransferase family 39 protein, partial [Acidimicrobiales bacterium]